MKYSLSTCALLLGSALAHAQPVHWTFSYTGFQDQEAGVYLPGMTLSGDFSGIDADGDGVLAREELASLLVGGKDYIACAASSGFAGHHLNWTATTTLQMTQALPAALEAQAGDVAAVPEPPVWALLGLGAAGLGLWRRVRQRTERRPARS